MDAEYFCRNFNVLDARRIFMEMELFKLKKIYIFLLIVMLLNRDTSVMDITEIVSTERGEVKFSSFAFYLIIF